MLINSTSLPLNARSAGWARFSAKACGATLHVIYDPHAERPIDAAIRPAKVNDITAAHAMPIEPGHHLMRPVRGWLVSLDFSLLYHAGTIDGHPRLHRF